MVTVKSYVSRTGDDDEQYILLELEGDMDLVKSNKTNRYYATVRSCKIFSTFDEQTAQRMVGKQIPGEIVRKQCEPYDFTVPETGEVIKLAHSWDYDPEGNSVLSKTVEAVVV